MAKLVRPRVQAMVLCDAVDKADQERGVFHLTGVRYTLALPLFPARTEICVFMQMSGHRGEADCHIEIDRTETDEVVYHTPPQTIRFAEPMVVVPVVFHLPDCEFPAAGVYYVQVFHAGKLIGERPLHVREGD